jgi:poly(3-hydroxybutyrate) depolymerase
MVAIMSATYPELYAAAGIHSGLAYGSAADLQSALAAMRGAANPATAGKSRSRAPCGRVRTIVFHGASDKTVDPSNAAAIVADARTGLADSVQETYGDVAGGRAYKRTVLTDARGVSQLENWTIEGLGHAWSGGSPDGSLTDAGGPDASREMLRFFLEAPAMTHRAP